MIHILLGIITGKMDSEDRHLGTIFACIIWFGFDLGVICLFSRIFNKLLKFCAFLFKSNKGFGDSLKYEGGALDEKVKKGHFVFMGS